MEKHSPILSDPYLLSKRQRQQDEPFPNKRLQVAAPHPPDKQLQDEEVLCNHCKDVDWSSLPTLAANGVTKSLKLRSFDATCEELKNSSCKICRILSTIQTPDPGRKYVLKAIPISSQLSYSDYRSQIVPQITVLGISTAQVKLDLCHGRTLAVLRLDNELGSKRISPSSIDYNKLKGSIDYCKEKHKRSCNPRKAKPSIINNVSGLKVISTETGQVIGAPDQCEYLALSYIWGKQEANSSVNDLRYAPPVIRDAILVTKSLGYSYLWVDRYCIPQDHSKEKHRMISQMDRIYENASITIIAAYGENSQVGLPGVSKVPRRLQKQVNIDDTALLELPLGSEDLRSSKWATRGWTYQEGYLSTRRLVFTETQVLFLCNGMYAAESLQLLLNGKYYRDETSDFSAFIPQFTSGSLKRHKLSSNNLLSQTTEFSTRELSYSDDSLNAFLGVLNYYTLRTAKFKSPVLHLAWGLIARKLPSKDGFSAYLFWFHKTPATRRPQFPSWSWTGWGGPVHFTHAEIILQSVHGEEKSHLSYWDWEIFMPSDEGGRDVNLDDFARKTMMEARNEHWLYQPSSKQLHVSCLIVPIHVKEFSLTEDQRKQGTKIVVHDNIELGSVSRGLHDGPHWILQIWKEVYIGVFPKLDQQVHLEQQDCILGLLFVHEKEPRYGCLLVREVAEGFYERIGVIFYLTSFLEDNMYSGQEKCMGKTWAMVFLDATASILDKVTISDMERSHPFVNTAERRTICLI